MSGSSMTFAFQFCSRIGLKRTVASPMFVKPPAVAGMPVASDGEQKNDVTMRYRSGLARYGHKQQASMTAVLACPLNPAGMAWSISCSCESVRRSRDTYTTES